MIVSTKRSASRAFDVRSRDSDSGVVMRMSARWRWKRARSAASRAPAGASAPRRHRRTTDARPDETARADRNADTSLKLIADSRELTASSYNVVMGDAGEGLIDADSRIQERMEELERER